MTVSDDDLRRLLIDESLDVEDPERFRARLDTARVQRRTVLPMGWYLLAVAALVAVLATGGRLAPWLHTGTSGSPAADSAAPHTEHLSLRPLPRFVPTLALDLGDREVLQVRHESSAHVSLDGGAVTLYAAGVFDATPYEAQAVPVRVAGRTAWAGHYAYTGIWGPVSTLAWPVDSGRWVTVQYFAGINDAASRALERAVAAAVVVR